MRISTPKMPTTFGSIPGVLSSLCALVCVLAIAGTATAIDTILYDSQGFESPPFTAGISPVDQDDSNPWQAFGGTPDAYTVTSSFAASGLQSIQGNGNGLNDGSFAWPYLGYTPQPNDLVRIQVDMARTLSPVADDSSPVYAIDVADEFIDRTTRFGLQYNAGDIRAFISVPINAQGDIDPNGPGIRSEFLGAAIPSAEFVHFEMLLDYTSKTVSLAMNGTSLGFAIPFRTQTSTFLDSAALQVGAFDVSNDHGWFDNYIVSVVQNVPGDVNFDHIVDIQDITLAANNWLETGKPGDANHDGVVDIQDITLMANNWLDFVPAYQVGGGAGASPSAIPEPSAIVIASLGGLMLVFGRRMRGAKR
jgi:hypothetical protein